MYLKVFHSVHLGCFANNYESATVFVCMSCVCGRERIYEVVRIIAVAMLFPVPMHPYERPRFAGRLVLFSRI